MRSKVAGAMLLAFGIGLAGAGAGLAAGSADDMINARQAAMKTTTKAMKALVSILKGESAYDNAAVQGAVKSIRDAQAGAAAAGAWDASSQTGGTVQTKARPEVWSDAAGFAAAWSTMDKALAAIAAAGDEAGFKAAFPALGAACKGCHEKYRAAE